MAKLSNITIAVNSDKHRAALTKQLNQAIASLTAVVNEYDKFAPFLHTEAVAGDFVDNQDSNQFLRFVGRKADDLATVSAQLTSLKDLKGADNTETATNMTSHITAKNYVHSDYKENFESE